LARESTRPRAIRELRPIANLDAGSGFHAVSDREAVCLKP
jgi:hypothetical protein